MDENGRALPVLKAKGLSGFQSVWPLADQNDYQGELTMQKGFSSVDYSDGRLVPHKGRKPIAPHLRPDYWPTKERESVSPVVKIRRGGRVIAAISLGEDSDLISLVQNI